MPVALLTATHVVKALDWIRTGPRALVVFCQALVLLGLLLISHLSLSSTAEAQRVLRSGSTFLDPFPNSDVYHLTTIGDDFVGGLFAGLSEQLGNDARVSVNPKPISFAGIMSRSFDDQVRELDVNLTDRRVDVAVVMMGYWDRVSLRSSQGRRVRVGTEEWIAEYSRRVDLVMKAVRRAKAATYWVGLPILAKSSANEAAQLMNNVIRERAYLNGIKYIDIYAGFANEQSNFAAYGPDLDGKVRKLRLRNGIGFTRSGNRKLSNFVEQELRRDLVEARANRTVPLLGSAEDQARINPQNVAHQKSDTSSVTRIKQAAASSDTASGKSGAGGPLGQKLDNGAITLKVRGPGGRIEEQTFEIVRPAIPASVVSLMGRRQRASQMGDMLVQQIDGGLTIMNTVTSSRGRGRGRLSPTQAPYFRLLVKGERLPPKPGRADDVRWQDVRPPERQSGQRPAAASADPKG